MVIQIYRIFWWKQKIFKESLQMIRIPFELFGVLKYHTTGKFDLSLFRTSTQNSEAVEM